MMDWIELFREMGRTALDLSRDIASSGRGTERLVRGAGGDMTMRFDQELEDAVLSMVPEGTAIMSEEAGMIGEGDQVLVIDPLDGSLNAIRGIANYSISIALVKPPLVFGNIISGYVKHLVTGTEYWAEVGRGAFRDGLPITPSRELHAIGTEIYSAPPETLAKTLSTLQAAKKIRCLGSVALDLVYVADGTLDAFVDMRGIGRTFDVAAGYTILKEASGLITDERGRSIEQVEIGFDVRKNIIASGAEEVQSRLLSLVA